jgi:hypothetical protein
MILNLLEQNDREQNYQAHAAEKLTLFEQFTNLKHQNQ